MKKLSGLLDGRDLTIGIVVSRFNEVVTAGLLQGALDRLVRLGVSFDSISTAWVPGAFEMPLVAKAFINSGKVDAVICLGAVIRGATAHFDYVCGPVSSELARLSVQTGTPVGFGLLTTDTLEQAVDRAGAKCGNKGAECAETVVELVRLLRLI